MKLSDQHVEIPRMRPREYIKIRGANEHNLKNLDVDIPRNELVVLTGLSGSGKSSLAFDTIYAEGQRRYMESLSSYARQFLGQMEKPNVEKIDGLLADLGVSSHHFDDETRGFSFRFDAPLDMRMNKRSGKTAADILNAEEEETLADIFYLYGELKNSRRIASAVVKARQQKPIVTTHDFINVVEPLFKREREKKEMAKLFQALRIEVNHEMDALKEMLMGATELLRPGGRLSVITYHSLEDRMVKNIMKSGNTEGKINKDFFGRPDTPFKMINKVTLPTAEEQERNPRSRSAKLRIAEKKEE